MPFTLLGNNALITDPTKIRQDLTSLALHSAVADNKSAYNLTNSFIDQFEDDTGIATETNTDRNSSEYITTAVSSVTSIGGSNTNIPLGSFSSRTEYNPTTGGWSSSYTNDAIRQGNSYYTSYHVDQLFDMAYEFKIFIYFVDSAGNQTHFQYPAYTLFFSTNISQSPDAQWSGFGNNHVSDNNYGDTSHAQLFDGTTNQNIMGASSFTNSSLANAQNSNVTVTGNHRIANYHNANQDSGSKGFFLHNKRSSNELVAGFCASNTLSEANSKSYAKVTVNTSGITDGLFAMGGGLASGTTGTRYVSMTYNGGGTGTSERTYGTANVTTLNGTGTIIGNTQTASSSTTKVSGVMLYKDSSGTATLGTDLKVYFSCDNGSNWTEVSSYGTVSPEFTTGIKMIRLGETTCTAGTQIKYKAEFANQSSGSKETQLHGIGLNY